MSDFTKFSVPVERQFKKMQKGSMFRVNLDKDALWNVYLDSFPAGANEIFRTRREYDCSCCKQFIRSVGDAVSLVDGQLVSIWDVQTEHPFQTVADKLSEFVKKHVISDVFLTTENRAGTAKSIEQLENGKEITWNHFFSEIDKKFVVKKDAIGTELGRKRDKVHVFNRGLNEITMEAVDTVLDLIAQGSLYRGEENRKAVEEFRKYKVMYDKLSEDKKKTFCWSEIDKAPGNATHIKNNFIGTLLMDVSEDKDLDAAVRSFESKAYGYMRSTSVVSKKQVEAAKAKITELDLDSAFERRHAVITDVSINDILFADRDVKPVITGSLLDKLIDDMPKKNKGKKLDKVEEIGIQDFIKDILPRASSLEVLFESKHRQNLCSLIAPVHSTARKLFKWENPFSWAYTGEAADSMVKERVKKAGGKVDGDVRCSLMWFNTDDLDLHLSECEGSYTIYYGNKGSLSPSKGVLDVDMNAGSPLVTDACENITYADIRTLKKGVYKLYVNQFNKRNFSNPGFVVEIEVLGVVRTYSYEKVVERNVVVATFECDGKGNVKVTDVLPSSEASVKCWGIDTNAFHKVQVMTLSPNFWNDEQIGNKHYMFILNKCLSDEAMRGFFNEQLRPELYEHRKAFEYVGSKIKVQPSAEQMSGLGFSSTQRNSLVCNVSGSFNRTVKIIF